MHNVIQFFNVASWHAGSGQRTYNDDDDHYQRAKGHASASADKATEAVDEATTSGARRQVLGLGHHVC